MIYIEKGALIKRIRARRLIFDDSTPVDEAIAEQISVVLEELEEAPDADVSEVRHGEWLYHECVSSYQGCKSGYSCSVCNAFVDEDIFDTAEFHKVFCGECGAKMGGERSENENTEDSAALQEREADRDI